MVKKVGIGKFSTFSESVHVLKKRAVRNAIIGHFDTKMAIIGQERPYFDPLLAMLSPFLSVLMYCFFCTDFVLEKMVFCTEFPYA